MKTATQLASLLFAALLLAPLAAAQSSSSAAVFAELPSCALTCLVAALGASSCSATNTTCMCHDTQLLDTSTTCILANCTVLEALSAKNITAVGCDQPVRDKSGVFRATAIALGCLTGAFVLARFAYRVLIARIGVGADDWAALTATVVGVPSTVITIHGLAANGLGRDVWTLPAETIYRFLRFFYIIEVEYFVNVALLKLTLLLFYLRIFPARGVRRLLWATIAFDGLFAVAFLFIGIFQCRPISFYWTNWDGQHAGHCLNVNAIGWANAAISIALDFWMLAVPLWQLRSLRLHWKKKISVALMFFVGTFVTVVSILRLRSLVSFAKSTNATWDNYDVISWSTIEINVGIICSCLPSIRLLLVHFFPRAFGSSAAHYYHSYGPSGGGGGGSAAGDAGGGGGGGGSRSHGGGRRNGGDSQNPTQRSIPLRSALSSFHKGTTDTTVTSVTTRDEELDELDLRRPRNDKSNDKTSGGGRPARSASSRRRPGLAPASAAGAASGLAASGNGGGAGAAEAAPGGILYSTSYAVAVEYGAEYHDEARLVDTRAKPPDSRGPSERKSESDTSL